MATSLRINHIRESVQNFPGAREVRILFEDGPPLAGVFNNEEAIIDVAKKFGASPYAKGVYISLNQVSAHLITNKLGRDYYISSEDIVTRDHYMIDFDTVSNLEETLGIAIRVRDWLTEFHDWPTPLFACSGNGYHLIYTVDPLSQSYEPYIKDSLDVISNRFSSSIIDVKVANIARHARIYGTLNHKNGVATESYIRNYAVGRLTLENIKSVANMLERIPATETTSADDVLSSATLDFLKNGAPSGNRNNLLFSAACNLFRCGYSQESAIEKLMSPSLGSGLSMYEVTRTVGSAYSKDRKTGEMRTPVTLHSMWNNFPEHSVFDPDWGVKTVPPYMRSPWDQFSGQTMIATYSSGKVCGVVSLDDKFLGRVSVLGGQMFSGKEEVVSIVSGAQRWLDLMLAGELVLGLVPTSQDSVLVAKTIPMRLKYV